MKPLLLLTAAALVWVGAAAADGGFQYPGETAIAGSPTETLQLNAARIGNIDGHEAVWYGVQTKDNQQWIQVGFLVDRYRTTPCVYLEEALGPDNAGYTFTCLRPARFGEKISVRYTQSSRHGYVAWVDGKPVGSLKLAGSTTRYATAEKYLGGALAYTITQENPE